MIPVLYGEQILQDSDSKNIIVSNRAEKNPDPLVKLVFCRFKP